MIFINCVIRVVVFSPMPYFLLGTKSVCFSFIFHLYYLNILLPQYSFIIQVISSPVSKSFNCIFTTKNLKPADLENIFFFGEMNFPIHICRKYLEEVSSFCWVTEGKPQ